jgi:hypothetical protein
VDWPGLLVQADQCRHEETINGGAGLVCEWSRSSGWLSRKPRRYGLNKLGEGGADRQTSSSYEW